MNTVVRNDADIVLVSSGLHIRLNVIDGITKQVSTCRKGRVSVIVLVNLAILSHITDRDLARRYDCGGIGAQEKTGDSRDEGRGT